MVAERGPDRGPNPEEAAYDFEKDGVTVRSRARATKPLEILLRRLGLAYEGDVKRDECRSLLEELVIHVHLSIGWYDGKLAQLEKQRKCYMIVSLCLLAAIPVLLLGVSWWAKSQSADSVPIVTAQLSAVLTGIFAFYRGISAYLDRRAVAGAFAEARSALKTQLYAFEESWKGKITKENLEQFKSAIHNVISKAREIVDTEQRKYFENLTFPSLDLGAILRGSQADATGLVSSLAAVPIAAAKERADAERKLQQQVATVASYRAMLNDLTTQFSAATDDSERKRLRDSIADTRSKLQQAELSYAIASAAAKGI